MRILILSLLLVNLSFSQEYTLPFPEGNTAWVTSEFGGGIPGEFYSSYYKYFTKGIDTVYHDTTYHTLFVGNVFPTDVTSNFISSYYRVDSLKVFNRFPLNDFNNEYVLYDFGMQIGDTLFANPNMGGYDHFLDSIDSIEIGGYFYRKFNFSCINCWGGQGQYWIEGIGSNSGFYPFETGGERNVFLSCFYTNNHGISIENNLEVHSCYGVGVEEDLISQLKIFPNPTSDFISIEGNSLDMNFFIFDLSEKSVLKGSLNSMIDLSQLENGIYFLNILKDGIELKTEKIIKQ